MLNKLRQILKLPIKRTKSIGSTAYQIPESYTDFGGNELKQLLDALPTKRLPIRKSKKKVYYSQVALINCWYILTALATSLGDEAFNERVGVRPWHDNYIMVDVLDTLSNEETIKALIVVKKLLSKKRYPKANRILKQTCVLHVSHFNKRLRSRVSIASAYLPRWDEISEIMTLDR
jgi:hypothetical protein